MNRTSRSCVDYAQMEPCKSENGAWKLAVAILALLCPGLEMALETAIAMEMTLPP